MKTTSTTVTVARIARSVGEIGHVTEPELEMILREHGVHQDATAYKRNLIAWGHLQYDPSERKYRLTKEGGSTSTVTITMPFLNAKEVRRDLVAKFAGYAPLITVGEVE